MPARPAASLSLRLVAAALVWLAVMLALGGGALAWAFRDTLEREFSHRLDAMLRGLIASVEAASDGSAALVRSQGEPRFDQVYSGWYWQVTEPSGRRLRSRSMWDAVFDTTFGHSDLTTRHLAGPKGEDLLVAERDIAIAGVNGPVHVLVAGDLAEVRQGVRRFDLLLASALGLLGLGLAVAVAIQVRFGLRPLRAMVAELGAVRAGERARLEGRYPREVAPLAETMNAVLDKDAQLIERARAHVGNLAHGLKTPLAVLAAQDEPAPDLVRQQVRAMRRLVEHHLGRASAVAGAGRLGERVAVDEVAAGIVGALARIFAERNLSITRDIEDGAVYRGHREDFEEILGNLMENACKWAAARVRVSARMAGGLVLRVEDDGPGLSPEQAAEATRRGRRLDEMAEGWGLGLSIVADLVEVGGGTLSFARSDLGGLAAEIRFPEP